MEQISRIAFLLPNSACPNKVSLLHLLSSIFKSPAITISQTRQLQNETIILLSLRNIQVSFFLVLSFIILWHSLVYFIAGYDWRPRSTGHLEGWRDITATCHPSNVETCLPGQPTPPFRHGYRGWYLWNQTRFAKDFGRTATSEIRQDLRRIFSTLRECHKMIQERT